MDITPVENDELTLPVPFKTQTCEICVKLNKGNYLLYDLNNAMQHYRRHHLGLKILFQCTTCDKKYKSKHAALCHTPKCSGPVAAGVKSEQCNICEMAFSTKSGLSQHERIRHPAERNEKRAKLESKQQTTRPRKGFGKVWTKEEIEAMALIESSQGDTHDIVQQIAKQLPNKTIKQIRDKRREPSYKSRLKQPSSNAIQATNVEEVEIIAPSSDSEPERSPPTGRLHVSETEEDTDEEATIQQQHCSQYTATGTSLLLPIASETTTTTGLEPPTIEDPTLDQANTTDLNHPL
jgi:hypothetical protein